MENREDAALLQNATRGDCRVYKNMYGYVIPDKPNILLKDFTMFRAFYCGLCKSLAKTGSQASRFLTNYDCTFLSVYVHAALGERPEITPQVCVLNPVQKKAMAKPSALSLKVADATVLLAYHKAADDVQDGDGKKRAVKSVLKNRFKQAEKNLPESAVALRENFAELARLEGEKCTDIEKASDTFSRSLAAIVKELMGEKYSDADDIFAHALGKWIYFIDAIDDIEEDHKKKRYNALLFSDLGQNFKDKNTFLEAHKAQLNELIARPYNAAVAAYNSMKNIAAGKTMGEGVLSNIIYLGMPSMAAAVLGGDDKCRKTRL